jgi:hypothetical protein
MSAVSRALEGNHFNAQVAHASLPSPPPGHLGKISTRTTRQKTGTIGTAGAVAIPARGSVSRNWNSLVPVGRALCAKLPVGWHDHRGVSKLRAQASPPPCINAGPPSPCALFSAGGPMARTRLQHHGGQYLFTSASTSLVSGEYARASACRRGRASQCTHHAPTEQPRQISQPTGETTWTLEGGVLPVRIFRACQNPSCTVPKLGA